MLSTQLRYTSSIVFNWICLDNVFAHQAAVNYHIQPCVLFSRTSLVCVICLCVPCACDSIMESNNVNHTISINSYECFWIYKIECFWYIYMWKNHLHWIILLCKIKQHMSDWQNLEVLQVQSHMLNSLAFCQKQQLIVKSVNWKVMLMWLVGEWLLQWM